MRNRLSHKSTMLACYNGYVVQAICINLAPLLYLTFQNTYSLSLSQISSLIAGNFTLQLMIDLLASCFADRVNARVAVITAHLSAVLGLIGLSLFPTLLQPYAGLFLAVSLLGIGGGLIEVLISPLMEACPTEGKGANMSLLHSFYCWGQAGVVLFSSVFFRFFAIGTYWKIVPCLWAIIPFLGAIAFCFVPIYRLPAPKKEQGEGKRNMLSPLFFTFLVMMLCAGASELIMSQWASSFAEAALGIEKSLGDLLGPCAFALMMGLTRAFYGKVTQKIRPEPILAGSCLLCVVSYLLAAFSPLAWLSLVGCMLCGVSVGIFWPCTLSRAAERLPGCGMSMFAVLALAGDLGCLLGPSVAGKIADLGGGDLRRGFVFALLFPFLNLLTLLLQTTVGKKKARTDTEGSH